MFPTLQLGPLNIQTPGLLILISFWVGLTLSERYSARHGYPGDKLYNLVFISLAAGIVGARLSFALGNLSAFSGNPINLFSLNTGLLDSFGGIASACLAAVIYGHRKRLVLWDTLDALTPLFAVLMVGISVSHLASGNAYGSITTLPWGIELWGARRHPSQIYEIIASCLTLVITLRESSHGSIRGSLFLKFIIVTSIWLILVEGYKGDSLVIASGFRGTQIGFFIVLTVAIFLYNKLVANANTHITGNN